MDPAEIKSHLITQLKAEHCFWSHPDVDPGLIDDETLIEKTLLHLDLPDIRLLFSIFSKKKIKGVWLQRLVPLGDWFRVLNTLYAWYYFDIKRPKAYLKSMETRHLNRLCL